MAKYGGELQANTNLQVATADMSRQAVFIHNLETTSNHNIFVQFDAAASTTLSDGSWPVDSGETLELHVEEWPEIRGSINLKSAHDADYVIRTVEDVAGTPTPAYVPPTVITKEVYGVSLANDTITLISNTNVPAVGDRFRVTTPGTLKLDGNTPLSSVIYYVISVSTSTVETDTFATIKISSREDRSRVVDVSAGPENDPLASTGIILTKV